jgi:Xaa-Pro aminopeptidase
MAKIKKRREIKLIKKAAKISNHCIKIIEKALEEEITERELANRIKKEINRHNATLAFRTIVCSGKRCSMIHAKPAVTNTKISGFGFVDFGVRYKGYVSDVTVPFIKDKISPTEKKIIKLVLEAYKLAIKSVRIGMPCWKLHEKVDKFFRMHGFKLKHALGHGIGRRVHEKPIIGKPSKPLRGKARRKWERIKKITFQPGMVFTIEPAIYTKNFGCRIENDFLLEKNGLVRLTNAKLINLKKFYF